MENEIEVPGKLPKNLHKDMLVKIADYVLEGLSEDEACILSGFPPKDFKEIKQKNHDVAMYVQKKKIEFKRKHLRLVGAKGNDKNSMWLLEALLPEEFGTKRKGGDTTVNVIGAIIKDVQMANELPVKGQDGVEARTREMKTIEVKDVLK